MLTIYKQDKTWSEFSTLDVGVFALRRAIPLITKTTKLKVENLPQNKSPHPPVSFFATRAYP